LGSWGIPMSLKIRNESTSDAAKIEALTEEAFRTAEHTSHTEQFIVNALRTAGKLSISLVAEIEGEIVGHVAVSPVFISDGSEGWYGLGPISVLPSHQKHGIGTKLMEEVINALKKTGAPGCVLLGDPLFYKRFGFKVFPEIILSGVPPEYFQALPLKAQIPNGEVTYHEAFNAKS